LGNCVRDLGSKPWIQLFVWPVCNLSCPNCSNRLSHPETRSWALEGRRDLLSDPGLLDLIETAPPTHFYISGGEPLIHPRLKDFVVRLGRGGHTVSLDTNISLPMGSLRELFSAWSPEWFGFVNVSHHLVCDVGLDFIEQRCRLLADFGVPYFVKYVGVPELLPQIRDYMLRLRDQQVGAAVSILAGPWKGRWFPSGYTPQETRMLLDMVTLNTHGLQVFDGVHSRGIPCRGGQDFIAWNMNGKQEVIPCCHGSANPTSLGETFFGTARRDPIACSAESCLGDMMFIFGINGIADESARLDALCAGTWEFLGVESVLEFVQGIVGSGFRLVNPEKFAEVERDVAAGCTS
jgi:pyruvate-formate lyase-activating enzyme